MALVRASFVNFAQGIKQLLREHQGSLHGDGAQSPDSATENLKQLIELVDAGKQSPAAPRVNGSPLRRNARARWHGSVKKKLQSITAAMPHYPGLDNSPAHLTSTYSNPDLAKVPFQHRRSSVGAPQEFSKRDAPGAAAADVRNGQYDETMEHVRAWERQVEQVSPGAMTPLHRHTRSRTLSTAPRLPTASPVGGGGGSSPSAVAEGEGKKETFIATTRGSIRKAMWSNDSLTGSTTLTPASARQALQASKGTSRLTPPGFFREPVQEKIIKSLRLDSNEEEWPSGGGPSKEEEESDSADIGVSAVVGASGTIDERVYKSSMSLESNTEGDFEEGDHAVSPASMEPRHGERPVDRFMTYLGNEHLPNMRRRSMSLPSQDLERMVTAAAVEYRDHAEHQAKQANSAKRRRRYRMPQVEGPSDNAFLQPLLPLTTFPGLQREPTVLDWACEPSSSATSEAAGTPESLGSPAFELHNAELKELYPKAGMGLLSRLRSSLSEFFRKSEERHQLIQERNRLALEKEV